MTRLTFVGDIACDRPLLKAAKRGKTYDFSRVFKTEKVFTNSDLVIGNLESCFGGGNYGTKPYHYSVPDSFCNAIKAAGFDIVSTANNHCLDEGVEGLERTLSLLDQAGIAHTGTFLGDEKKRYQVIEKNGLKIAFYSLTYSVNPCYESCSCEDVSKHVNILAFKRRQYSKNPMKRLWQIRLRPELVKIKKKIRYGTIIPQYTDKLTPTSINPNWLHEIDNQIKAARQEADILVIMLHIGGQFNLEPGDFSQYMMTHLCELGADIIAAHHPHCLQKIERRGNTHIAYSLGGYCLSPSGEYLVKESLPEYSVAWHIDIDKNKRIVDSSVTLLKCIEDPDHYVHVVEAEEDSQNIKIIRERLQV